MREGKRKNIMDDLEERAEVLSAETGTNLYKKALKWQELALEAIERLKIMESMICNIEESQGHTENITENTKASMSTKPLNCEGPLLGERGKVDIRQFTCSNTSDSFE
jgi:hypothetical protein